MSAHPSRSPSPSNIVLHTVSRVLEITFDDGASFRLPFEFLRVYSPSAEVRGHGPGQEVLQVGKRDVMISDLRSVGHYAIQPVFSDGHDSGIYAWDYLYELGVNQPRLWSEYLERLDAAGASREPTDAPPSPPAASCARH
ncbi:MAG TPA: DUF971 domain-containing protein [Burkholderiaceae bacterium]|nr:DUF971 domain-containing protein [Burkholderiaceae bacterium]HQR75044.1 DUF971 domain-containing protein [Burkholderiaceae bacterium]